MYTTHVQITWAIPPNSIAPPKKTDTENNNADTTADNVKTDEILELPLEDEEEEEDAESEDRSWRR